jgi:hypothetical protein
MRFVQWNWVFANAFMRGALRVFDTARSREQTEPINDGWLVSHVSLCFNNPRPRRVGGAINAALALFAAKVQGA